MVAMVLLAKAVVGLDVFSKLLDVLAEIFHDRNDGWGSSDDNASDSVQTDATTSEEVVQVQPANRGRGNAFQKHNCNIF